MTKNLYYDGTKLLSLKDINNNTPEIYVVSGNRSGGKTTYFNRLLVNKFINKGEKFGLIYRFNYELQDVADKFFKDIQKLFFNDYEMTAKKQAKGVYYELFIKNSNDKVPKSCGYALSLNNADQLKKNSHYFSDIKRLLFDEFQSETNHYCDNEIVKFISLHKSIARGNGEFVRYVPVYMLSNNVSLINPYFVAWDISNKITEKTKFLRWYGLVFEKNFNENSANAQKSSSFDKAFYKHKAIEYSQQNVYLNDNISFIEKPKGKSRYLATLIYEDKAYAVRSFDDLGIIYCDDKPDKGHPQKFAITTQDHNLNYVLLKSNQTFIENMRFYFNHGCFRFKNLLCKQMILTALSYV